MALKKAGALWLKDGKNGKFMSGQVELDGRKINILVFKNTHKEQPNHPDYTINIPVDDDPRQQAEPMRQAMGGEFVDDNIPF